MSSQSSMTGAFVCLLRDPDGAYSNFTRSQGAYPDISELHDADSNATHRNIDNVTGLSTTSLKHYVTKNAGKWQFSWGKETQGLVLSSFYVGYYLSQVPASLASVSLSATRLLTVNLLLVSMCQVLAVFATRLSLGWLLVERALTGFFVGFLFAPSWALAGKWSPGKEKIFLSSIAASGIMLGNTLTYVLSAGTCELDLQGGWPFEFYTLAIMGVLLALIFHILVADSPFISKLIPQEELTYVSEDIPDADASSTCELSRIPFKAVMTSRPFWATIVSQIGGDWMLYAMVSIGPLYLKEVLQMTDTELNLLTGIPYILPFPCVFLAGSLCNHIVAKDVLTNTQVRKLNDAIAKLVPASVVLCLTYLPENSVLAVAFLNSLATAALGFSSLSFNGNLVDLAPAWAGLLAGIAQFGSVWVSFVVPVVFNYITAGRTREEWRLAFFITAVIQVMTLTFYCFFASGEIQPWAVVGREYDDGTATEELKRIDKCGDVTTNGRQDNGESLPIIQEDDHAESKAVRETGPNYGAASITHIVCSSNFKRQ